MCQYWLTSLLQGARITHGQLDMGRKTPGYTLHEDEDDRVVTQRVKFTTSFSSSPVVITGFSMLDLLIDSDVFVFGTYNI